MGPGHSPSPPWLCIMVNRAKHAFHGPRPTLVLRPAPRSLLATLHLPQQASPDPQVRVCTPQGLQGVAWVSSQPHEHSKPAQLRPGALHEVWGGRGAWELRRELGGWAAAASACSGTAAGPQPAPRGSSTPTQQATPPHTLFAVQHRPTSPKPWLLARTPPA